MRWVVLVTLSILALVLLPSFVFAQEITTTSNETEINPGILPDSPFYRLKIFGERIRLMLTFNRKAKIKLRMKIAEHRLAEAEKMALRNKTEIVERLVARYQERLKEAEEEREQLQLRNITTEDIDEWMNRTTNKHIYVLRRVMQNAPEQAQFGLQTALQRAERNREKIRERLMKRAEERLRERVREKIKERIENRTTTTTTETAEIEETTTTTAATIEIINETVIVNETTAGNETIVGNETMTGNETTTTPQGQKQGNQSMNQSQGM